MAQENDPKSSRLTGLEADDVVRVIVYCSLFFPHEMDAVDCHCYLYDRKYSMVLFSPRKNGKTTAREAFERDRLMWARAVLDLTQDPSSTHNLIDDHGTDPRLPLRGGGSRARRIGMGLGRILGRGAKLLCLGVGRMARWWVAPTGEWGKPEKGDW